MKISRLSGATVSNTLWIRRAGVVALLMLGLGIPLTAPEHFWLLLVALPTVMLSTPRTSKAVWGRMFVLCLVSAVIRAAVGPGDVHVATNVFSPGIDHFRTVIPEAVMEAASSDFRARYDEYELRVPRPVSRNFGQWGLPEGTTLRKRFLAVDSLIDWPLGAANSLNYNTRRYNDELRFGSVPPAEVMDRRYMPYYAIVTFAPRHSGRELCFRGNLFLRSEVTYHRLGSPLQLECFLLPTASNGQSPTIVAYQTGPNDELRLNLEVTLQDYLAAAAYRAFPLLVSTIVFVVLTDLRHLTKRRKIVLAVMSVVAVTTITSFRTSVLGLPPLGTFVLYLEGGDGLTYAGYGRQIAHAVLEGRYAEAIRGGESVFYYQPGFRYIQAANLAFFGPSSAGAVLAAALVTVALLGLSRRFLPNGRDWPILLLWLLPILSAFDAAAVGFGLSTPIRTGATLPQVLQEGVYGLGEPTALLFLLAASAVCLHLIDSPTQGVRGHCLAGFLMSIAILIRLNWMAPAAVVLGGVVLTSINHSNWRQVIWLICSMGLLFLVPLHNYWFAGEWIFTTTALTTLGDRSLYWPAAGSLWAVDADMLREAISLERDAIQRVLNSWGMLLTEGRMILIASSVIALVMPAVPFWVRVFAAAALVGFAPYLLLAYRDRYVVPADLFAALVFWRLALFEGRRFIAAAWLHPRRS